MREQEHYPLSMGARMVHGGGTQLRPNVTAKLRTRPPLDYVSRPAPTGCGWGYVLATVATLYTVLFAPLALLIGAVGALS